MNVVRLGSAMWRGCSSGGSGSPWGPHGCGLLSLEGSEGELQSSWVFAPANGICACFGHHQHCAVTERSRCSLWALNGRPWGSQAPRGEGWSLETQRRLRRSRSTCKLGTCLRADRKEKREENSSIVSTSSYFTGGAPGTS